MALSELDMMNLWAKQLKGCASQRERLFGFGYAVEAAARRDALEEAAKKCELVAQRWSHHMVAPSAALGCAAAIRELKEDIQ